MKLLSSVCLFLLTSFSVLASAQMAPTATGTRGLEDSRIDQFVMALNGNDLQAVAKWLDQGGYTLLSQFVVNHIGQEPKAIAVGLANRIFIEQQKVRNDRTKFVLLQTLLEETVMFSGVETAVYSGETKLSVQELAAATRVRGVPVIQGDALVQLGGGTLSSHFIAHSQSRPGLASHGLVVAQGGPNPEIIEALIEDGTNRRAPYAGSLARFFVLSAKTESERSRVAKATQSFITDFKIPFIKEGEPSDKSPLFYDSTMNPNRKKDGYYFCTALVQEIYLRSGISANPYPENKINWNILEKGSVEQGLYREINITETQVPAPGDALFNTDLAIRAVVLNTASLKTSRRLRAVIDAFFDILYANPKVRSELLAAFRMIPDQEVRKAQILAALDKLMADPEILQMLGEDAVGKVKKARATAEVQLPQTANMRQIAFFILMNSVMQDKALVGLERFESQLLKRHATPGELRAAATSMLAVELEKLQAALKKLSI